MKVSTHFNFNLPELTDAADIMKVTEALERIDDVMQRHQWQISYDSKESMIAFSKEEEE